MREDTMTPLERVETVVSLKKPDRVPVIPMMGSFFSARHAGVPMNEFVVDLEKGVQAEIQTFLDFGLRDMPHTSNPLNEIAFQDAILQYMKLPGRELPNDSIWQFYEQEVMKVEDYDSVIEHGWPATWLRLVSGIRHQTPDEVLRELFQWVNGSMDAIRKWESMGHQCFSGAGISNPYGAFSSARSLHQFALDLHRRPEKVLEALDASIDELVKLGVDKAIGTRAATQHGYYASFIGEARASGTFVSPKTSEKFFFPYMLKIANALIDAGVTPLFHFDNDWTPMLELFLEFPKAKCILEVDGQTDIFKAKKVLGDHMCLMGDVPATMFTLGTPMDVEAYCKRLIDEVGEGGGFILSSGCSVPHDAKPENVRAMIQTGNTYEFSKAEVVHI
jgi:Uroporphyrinogen decarboxylase (URO-D)